MVVSGKTYNTSTEYIYHETFKCIGIEVRLVDCPRYSVRCPSESKAAVVCGIHILSITSLKMF